jgi:hypothetical protein
VHIDTAYLDLSEANGKFLAYRADQGLRPVLSTKALYRQAQALLLGLPWLRENRTDIEEAVGIDYSNDRTCLQCFRDWLNQGCPHVKAAQIVCRECGAIDCVVTHTHPMAESLEDLVRSSIAILLFSYINIIFFYYYFQPDGPNNISGAIALVKESDGTCTQAFWEHEAEQWFSVTDFLDLKDSHPHMIIVAASHPYVLILSFLFVPFQRHQITTLYFSLSAVTFAVGLPTTTRLTTTANRTSPNKRKIVKKKSCAPILAGFKAALSMVKAKLYCKSSKTPTGPFRSFPCVCKVSRCLLRQSKYPASTSRRSSPTRVRPPLLRPMARVRPPSRMFLLCCVCTSVFLFVTANNLITCWNVLEGVNRVSLCSFALLNGLRKLSYVSYILL